MARYSGVSRAAEPVTVLPQFRPQSQNTVSRVRARREKKSGFALSSPCPCPTDGRPFPLLFPPACGGRDDLRAIHRLHPAVNPVARTAGFTRILASREPGGSRNGARLRLWLIRRLTDREKPVVKGTGCPIQWITVARLLLLLLLLFFFFSDPREPRDFSPRFERSSPLLLSLGQPFCIRVRPRWCIVAAIRMGSKRILAALGLGFFVPSFLSS